MVEKKAHWDHDWDVGVVLGGTDFVGPTMAPKWPTERSQGQYGMPRQHNTP